MGDSSDSEEFFDAEEFTPVKGSKRSSICKNINVTDSSNGEKERKHSKTNDFQPVGATSTPVLENTVLQDDRNTVKNVVQGRKRFQELRRCMQTEEEDEPDPGAPVSAPMEHPFKIISHDTMSLQSMTSLGRIGRILSGAAESHQNIRESTFAPSASSREPSTISDDPLNVDRNQTIALAMAEPDVIASTKANSLKQSRAGAVVAVSGAAEPRPVAPPRRKRRNKLHGSQSLSTTEGDNLSVSESHRPLEDLLVEPLSNAVNQTISLPSPASTIESLTREFQDSLELSQSRYADMSLSVHESRSSERASTSSRSSTATSLRPLPHHSTLDIKEAVKGDYVVRPQDEERSRGGVGDGGEGEGGAGSGAAGGGSARTHSEGRPPTTGTSSLGSATRRGGGARARRRSAGDPPQGAALGPQLSDIEILEQVTVLNLDTGERMPLSVAEHKLPQCINPLSLHIMRLTSEYIGRTNDDEHTRETDEESESVCAGGAEDEMKETKKEGTDRQTTAIKRKTEKLKRFFGSTVKKTVDAAKSLAQEVSHARHKEDVADIADDVRGEHNIKLKASNSHKGPYDFDGCVRYVQEMGAGEAGEAGGAGGHAGAVWCCKFSVCGRLLATAGQDRLLRIWVTRDAHRMFQDMRTKYNAKQKASPTPSQESLASLAAPPPSPEDQPIGPSAPFCPKPFCIYSGHTSDLLDVSWSKNNFILSSSMDKTVRLWHISRGECLCCFQHIDFVTAIVFHPRDDRYFLSGSLDGKLRLWDIPDKKVAVWNEVDGKTKLITAANFCQNGKFAVVGTYDGRCIFYTTDQLKYHTQIDVRSTRGKNSTGRKISGIEPMPNDDKILVTSNDSRIRLYDLRDLNLSCKYKGYVNVSSQIKASFSHDGKYIVSGSENQCIYIWKTCHDYSKFTSVRRDRNDFWEGIKAHNAVVTCAVFAPNPDHMIRMINEREEKMNANAHKTIDEKDEVKAAEGGMVSSSQTGHVLVSADFNGCIKVFVHKAKPKHSSLPASALA
ncbi:WD repeat-containing protein 44 isoform X6 [Nymphalis io]|uniref:WD repeat-containing protein 44 isoform X6 n=1 Tax=Inachis io TaxID=171585 RepID=UPI0021670E36|nr:WD repeat-containing protein 44 isoform X6 [Nymphalis io]